MVYENADLGAGAMGAENIYEMTNTPEPPKPSRVSSCFLSIIDLIEYISHLVVLDDPKHTW